MLSDAPGPIRLVVRSKSERTLRILSPVSNHSMLFLQKLPGFGAQPLLLEEGKAVAGYVDIDRHMEVGLRRANGAFRSHLNVTVLSPEGYLVLADDGGLGGVIGGRRATEVMVPDDGAKLVVQHRSAAGTEQHRSGVGDLVIKNLLEGRRPTRSHQAVEVGRRKEFRRGDRGFRHNG